MPLWDHKVRQDPRNIRPKKKNETNITMETLKDDKF